MPGSTSTAEGILLLAEAEERASRRLQLPWGRNWFTDSSRSNASALVQWQWHGDGLGSFMLLFPMKLLAFGVERASTHIQKIRYNVVQNQFHAKDQRTYTPFHCRYFFFCVILQKKVSEFGNILVPASVQYGCLDG
jgi:hypothetical protein